MNMTRLAGFLLAALVAAQWPASAAPSAVIVTGIAGSSENEEEFTRLAGETKRLLLERGLPADGVEILNGHVTREMVLDALKSAAQGSPGEFWLVLYGHSGKSQGGVPAFQVSGPRLTATDLKTALDAIPGSQYVFIGANESAEFLPVLQNSRRTVLSATKGEGEEDQPRYPASWINAFSENPKASFARIAARASQLVEDTYKTSNLAQSEHARMADPVTGQILEPPFGVSMPAEPETAGADAGPPGPLPAASDVEVHTQKQAKEWEQQPATAETRKIIAEAHAAPNPGGHAALVLEQRLGFTVQEDRATDRQTYWRVYIVRDEGVADWANQFFPQSPPAITTRLELARVIQPDGSSTAFNPAKLVACTDPEAGCGAAAMVYVPNAKAGCVVEMGFDTRQILNATLPHVSEELQVQRSVPVLKTALEIRVPEKPVYHVALNNVPAKAAESVEDGRRVLRWQLGALPAMESLPGDPPWQQWAAYASISSLPSWDEFAAWYRRLAEGSDAVDPTVTAMAAQLADGAKTRTEKIRRDFEFVSALRYIAIEIGVQGFRPRTPAEVLSNRYGDCKDKANLLVALLRSQGIASNFVLLSRGAYTDVNFPSWQFNHAIAFVPRAPEAGQPDDLWLDSTDSVTPFGFLPPGDFGQAGLVFGKDKAEFKTVVEKGGGVSEIHDEWELQQDADASWKGTFHRHTSGLADDMMRRAFRELTPMQRNDQIYRMLGGLWSGGDFAQGTVSNVGELRNGVEVRADVAAPAGEWPRIEAPALSAPERDRPLRLNDGQPLTLTQTLRLRYAAQAPEKLPEPMESDAGGEKMSVAWQRVDEHTVLRTARLEISTPLVPSADYASLRRALRGWNAALAH